MILLVGRGTDVRCICVRLLLVYEHPVYLTRKEICMTNEDLPLFAHYPQFFKDEIHVQKKQNQN